MKVLMSVLVLLICSNAFAKNKIKHCGNGTSDVKKAINFIHSNANSILNNTAGVDRKEKRRFKRKMKKVNVKCLDHKRVCKKHSSRAGVSRHIFKSAVVVCYNRIRSFFGSNSFCGLVDTIAHEFAHTARVDKARNHNDGPNNDEVYRLGDSAESLCHARGLNRFLSRK